MVSRNQIIAQNAYQCVAGLKENEQQENGQKLNNSYATLAHKLPTMILQNGLSQATGFLLAKASSETAHEQMLDHLRHVLNQIDDDFRDAQDNDAFHRKIIVSDLSQIMRYTREALEISGWLRRYVQGVLKRGVTGETEDEREAAKGGE
jgi:CRISPR-associated protein Cmr5